MQAPSAQDAYNKEIKDRLLKETFPSTHIPSGFFKWCRAALWHESKQSLNCDTATLIAAHDMVINASDGDEQKVNVSLFLMGFLINSVESKSPTQIASGDCPYLGILTSIEIMEQVWNGLVTPIKEAVMRKVQAQANISKSVPLGKRLIRK